MSRDDDDKTRRQIGKYTIVEQVGEGGCGIVYKGIDPELERTVAIKTLSSRELNFRNRFKREAKLIARLDHERIVRVYDAGIEEEEPYLVQEFLSGEDLKLKIARGDDLPLSTKVQILRECADGLGHAHDKGIVHRDVKPGNIRILDNGHVKIMDFGIAKQLEDATHQLTQVGFTVGTAAYLSPEQIDGTEVDRRSDVFAFGVVAYELLTYQRPFPGETISRLFRQITSEEPEPLRDKTPPETPERLIALIERCLQKNRDDRPQHMNEIQRELDAVLLELTGARPEAVAVTALDRGAAAWDSSPAPTAVVERPVERRELPRWFRPVAVASVIVVLLGVAFVIIESSVDAPAGPQSAAAGTASTQPAAVPGNTAPAGNEGAGRVPARTAPGEQPRVPTSPLGDPARLIVVSNNLQVSGQLLPALRRTFNSVVESPDAATGKQLHPDAGRTLIVQANVKTLSRQAYGTTVSGCEVDVTAQLQDAQTFEQIDTVSAASTEPDCDAAIRAATREVASKLRVR
jgi:serine/threonine-protein kinase